MRFFFLTATVLLVIGVSQVRAAPKSLFAQVQAYDGKSYSSVKTPEYLSYDEALRYYLVERVQRQFGINLDPKKYSGFDLLEIESLLKCKKSSESPDLFLRRFPKQP